MAASVGWLRIGCGSAPDTKRNIRQGEAQFERCISSPTQRTGGELPLPGPLHLEPNPAAA